MAASTKPPATSAGEFALVAVDEIDMGERLRPVDPIFADQIGRSIDRDGQATPIVVCKLPGKAHYTLVAGAHRLVGARQHGITHLRAEIIGTRREERFQREVSENLWRRGLDPVERAAFIAKQVELIKIGKGIDPSASGRAASANARWARVRGPELKTEAQDATDELVRCYGWSQEVAEGLGVSIKTIQRALQLYRSLPPSSVERLRAAHHPAIDSESELRKLMKLDDERQALVVDALLAGTRRVADAVDAVDAAAGLAKTKGPKKAGDKHYSAFFGAYHRMGLAERKTVLAQLAKELPAGYKLTFGEQLTSSGFPEGYEEEREKALVAIEGARDVIFGILEDSLGGEDVRIDEERAAALGQAEHDLGALNLAILADRVPLDTPKGDRA